MKKTIILFFFFLTLTSYSQNSFIVDKKGTKTIIRDDATEIILIDKRISYVLVGKTWEKFIKFEDLDYALVNGKLLKSFKLDGSKKAQVFFVLGETEDKTLISRSITTDIQSSSGRMTFSRTSYHMNVIDKEEKTIERIDFVLDSKKETEQLSSVSQLIRKYFSDCPNLIDYLKTVESNGTILNIFNNTQYINCK